MLVVCPRCTAANRVPPDRADEDPVCGKCGAAILAGTPIALDESRFDRFVGRSELPVVVDFWASWCGPCRAMAPVFDKAAETLEPKARFIKIDVDAEPDLARQFGVRGIPALFLFKDGKVAEHHAGIADIHLLNRWAQSAGKAA